MSLHFLRSLGADELDLLFGVLVDEWRYRLEEHAEIPRLLEKMRHY